VSRSSLSPRRLNMHRFKNILCVVDPNEKASTVVRRAHELVTLQGTSLTLVHIVKDVTSNVDEAR
jgi:hypothetical protein